MSLPPPLVPAEVDLRGMPFMPLDVVRLLDSDLFALSTGDEFKATITLYCIAWRQAPAASLPSNDRILAHLSGAGTKWLEVKTMALHGWELCADGRYYHPLIAEKAREAWKGRLRLRAKQNNEIERQRRYREDHKQTRDQLRALGEVAAWDTPMVSLKDKLQTTLRQRDGPAPVPRTGALPDMNQQRLREEQGQGELLNQQHVHQHGAQEGADSAEGLAGPVDHYDSPAPQAATQHSALPTPQATKRAANHDPLPGFATFYELYPRRQKRLEAEKAWRKLSPDPELQQTLMMALARHRQQDAWLRDNGQFIPLPASWLNDRRWEDEHEVAGLSDCPVQAIVDLYHQSCPSFDAVTVLDKALRNLIEERWLEHEAQQDLGFWQDFFTATSGLTSVYFCGQTRAPYLEALLHRNNFRDIVEGRAHA